MEKNLSKKYKLVKIYPGSGLIGRIKQISNHNLSNGHIELNGKLILPSEYKEFWEEVIEKDYEILSVFIRRSERDIIRKLDLQDSDEYINSLIKCDGNSIHSLKRLSDGEVFTVGDKITYGRNTKGEGKIIESIHFLYNKIYMKYTDDICKYDDWLCKNFQHFKKPLFTTEDGVDIFKNTKFWYIDNFIIKTYITKEFSEIESSYKTFSTKEKAEEYILMNKPCLSINEVRKHLVYRIKVSKLKELAKKKL